MTATSTPHLVVSNDNPSPSGEREPPALGVILNPREQLKKAGIPCSPMLPDLPEFMRELISVQALDWDSIPSHRRLIYRPTKSSVEYAHDGMLMLADVLAYLRLAIEASNNGDTKRLAEYLSAAEHDTRWGRLALIDAHARMTWAYRLAPPPRLKKRKTRKAKASPAVRGKSR
jgi:hypothetical protein